MEALNIRNIQDNFFIPLSNLYFDESLKELKSSEFKTYITILYIAKSIGPNTKNYFSNKKNLYIEATRLIQVSEKTFLKHLKTFESRGLISIEGIKIDFHFDIADSKISGYTSINILDLEYLILNLDNNELKLYLTIHRLLKGFNKKISKITYSQFKRWSGIKNKSIFISTRDSLVEKGFITALYDTNSNSYSFRVNDINNGYKFKKEDKKPHQVEKEPKNDSKTEEKKPYINKYIPNKNKYFKKSFNTEKYEETKITYKTLNEEKIFRFLDENLKTKYLTASEKQDTYKELIKNVEQHGDFKGKKITSTPDYYLSLENEKYGRVVDKIIDRLFSLKEGNTRLDENRKLYFGLFELYYPEMIKNLSDYTVNDLSKHKLDLLIKESPSVGYWNDAYIFEEIETKNPEWNDNYAVESQEYMNNLIYERVGDKVLSLEQRLDIINELIPFLESKYPTQDEIIFKREKLTFEEFKKRFLC